MKLAIAFCALALAAAANPKLDFEDSVSTCSFEKTGKTSLDLKGCGLAVGGVDIVTKLNALDARVKKLEEGGYKKTYASCDEYAAAGDKADGDKEITVKGQKVTVRCEFKGKFTW